MSEQPILININLASQDELTTISGIGPVLAKRIIEMRPYRSVDELRRVQGINTTLMESIRPAIAVYSPPSAQNAGLDEQIDGKNQKEAKKMTDETLERSKEEVGVVVSIAEAEGEDVVGVVTDDSQDEVEVIEAQAEIVDSGEDDLEVAEDDEITADLDEVGALDMESTEALAMLDGVEETPPDETAEELEEEVEVEAVFEAPPQDEPQAEVAAFPDEPLPSDATVTAPKKKAVPMVTRGQAIWMVILSSLLAFILALGASLGILASLNGGLRYATPSQMTTVRRQVDGLNAQATILQQDLDGLRGRMENLEGLSGRVGSMEENVGQLQEQSGQMQDDLDAAATRMDAFSSDLDAVNGQVEELRGETDKFNNFLNSLRELLDTVTTGTTE